MSYLFTPDDPISYFDQIWPHLADCAHCGHGFSGHDDETDACLFSPGTSYTHQDESTRHWDLPNYKPSVYKPHMRKARNKFDLRQVVNQMVLGTLYFEDILP